MRELDDQAGVAAYLGVSERTLEDWRYRSRGPRFVRVGANVRYRKTDVDQWLEANASKTA